MLSEIQNQIVFVAFRVEKQMHQMRAQGMNAVANLGTWTFGTGHRSRLNHQGNTTIHVRSNRRDVQADAKRGAPISRRRRQNNGWIAMPDGGCGRNPSSRNERRNHRSSGGEGS